ncbi:MAG: hypothetical protein GY770_28755 [Aestuariibacter sp.]|nr:hypothetical protein [Aestuariibacter sp.]
MKLEEKYPFIASWVVDGQIQIGQADSYHEPWAAIIDAGGTVWEIEESFDSLDDLFDEMERAIGRWSRETGVELADHQGKVIPWPQD